MAAAKNIILAGVKRVVLHDPEDVRISDLGANFYLSETDVGRNRVDACLDKLRELNTAVAVEPIMGTLSNADLTDVDVRASVSKIHALANLNMLTVPCSRTSVLPQRHLLRCMQVVVLTASTLAEAKRVDIICRDNGVAFIRAEIRGVFASVFADFGPEFTVLDVDGISSS